MTDITSTQITGADPAAERELQAPDGNPFSDPASPLSVRVRLERWIGDYAQEVGSVEFDGRAVFDSEPLRTVTNDMSDRDWVFYSAAAAGLVDEHDGPFTVEEPEELAEYIAHRRSAGMTEAYPSAGESLAAERLEHLRTKLDKALAEVERLRGLLGNDALNHTTMAAPRGR